MKSVIDFIEANQDKAIAGLCRLIRIPSVSAQQRRDQEVRACASLVVNELKLAGLTHVELIETQGHPVVFAESDYEPNKPTVLVYGHYDVQPEDPLDEWLTPPFEPTIKGNVLYARGSTDNKGQFYIHIKAVESYMKQRGKLPVNIKFLIEGEEEVSSVNLAEVIQSRSSQLACDAVLVSDTPMYGHNVPSIASSLRGLIYMQIDLTGPNQDLHSGNFGGSLQNPAVALASLLAKLKEDDGRVAVPGFYDDVLEISDKQRQGLQSLGFDEGEFSQQLGVEQLSGEPGYSTLERIWLRPTLDICGLLSGYVDEGAKTIIPSKAMAKVSARLVPNQNPQKIFSLIANFLNKHKPAGIEMTITDLHGGPPYRVADDSLPLQAALRAVEKAWRKTPVLTGIGGSIPIVELLTSVCSAPCILMGIGVPSENLHSPNEHLYLDHFHKGILASAYFIEEMSKLPARNAC